MITFNTAIASLILGLNMHMRIKEIKAIPKQVYEIIFNVVGSNVEKLGKTSLTLKKIKPPSQKILRWVFLGL